jgi:nucleoside-diphosphate-sugar epimerase
MASIKEPSVGLLGSTGNLGSTFLREVENLRENPGFTVGKIGRPDKISKDFNINDKGVIASTGGEFPSIIVNLSNSYFPNPTPNQMFEMEAAIIGVAKAISNSIEESGCSVISASTYFQYCPNEYRPWSHYSELKRIAKEIIRSTAESCGTNFTDFVLYDNFGGLPRNKFVDFLERSLSNGEQIDCTEGDQVLNLTHVSDLVNAFVSEVQEFVNIEGKGSQTYELRSDFTVNLRDLVFKAESSSGRQASINWGAIPYREREVFELWETGFNRPSGWRAKIEFESYIKENFQNKLKWESNEFKNTD